MEVDIIWLIIGVIAALIVGLVIGVLVRKASAEKKLGSAEAQAKRILEDAIKGAESAKKESIIAAKEEIFQLKKEADFDIKERRKEVSRLERRVVQKEETLDAKLEGIERKEGVLAEKIADTDRLKEDIAKALESQLSMLEKIAGLSREDAKAELISKLDSEMRHETAVKLAEYEERFKEEADAKAKDILSLAIQRCAADHVSEVAISVVQIPSDDMKGRIIGREGRNIRSIENLTGVELIIDDTPDVITVSGFDPVRREIARIALEKLVSDGRIHPARIEEMVEKARRDVDSAIKQAGEKAVFETGVHGLHPELIKLLGRMKYRTSYGQNALRHSVEVSMLAGVIAEEMGVDVTMARRAGLLHDIGKAMGFIYPVKKFVFVCTVFCKRNSTVHCVIKQLANSPTYFSETFIEVCHAFVVVVDSYHIGIPGMDCFKIGLFFDIPEKFFAFLYNFIFFTLWKNICHHKFCFL